MRTSLFIFKAGVKQLQAFLETTDNESELTTLLLQRQETLSDSEKLLLSKIASAKTDHRRYIYTVVIVSLYGLLERYVDALVEAFVHRVAESVESYQMMPDAIQKNHVLLSVDLVKAIAEERHRKQITQEEVVANLHSCLSGGVDFRVNGSAFVLHRGNISLQKIRNFLAAVGIAAHSRRVALAPEFLDFFRKMNPERDIVSLPDQELEPLLQPIDELVDRRNQVSHGVINLDDIESNDLLNERCAFVAAFGGALYELMMQEVLKYSVVLASVHKLGKPLAVYNDSIVCFEMENGKISVGDVLVAATGDEQRPFRYSRIDSLEVDKVSHQEILATQITKFGAKISFKANDQHDYYVVPVEMI